MFWSLLACVTAASAADSHPFSVEDLVRLKRLSEPALSPGESQIAFTLRETDLAADRGRTDIWLLDLKAANAQPVRVTSHPENDSGPQWSNDGRFIYFLSSRGGSQQVWRLPLAGGEAQAVTQLPIDVTTFKLAPDLAHIAVTLDVYPDCAKENDQLACTVARNEAKSKLKSTGVVYDRIFVRHWDTWDDGTETQLFVAPLEGGIANGAPRNLSGSLDADVPSKPFGDASEYSFALDSKSIVFAARIKGKSEPWSTNFDLYEVPVAGGAPKNLTADNLAWDTQPIFSSDGAWLAYRAMERPGFEADRFHIVLVNRKTGERRALTKQWDTSVDAMEFSKDNKSIFALADHLGQHALWSVDVRTGAARQLTHQGSISAMAVGRNTVYVACADFTVPADLYAVPVNGKAGRQVTQMNEAALAVARRGAAEQFTFNGWNDEIVHAYVVTPADFDANKKYPVAFMVHGGPQVSYGNNWSYRWNPQTYAGAGYAFVAIDFHGSPGYGQKFTDSISHDWGGKPLVDLQKGLDAALAKYPWLDRNRICALGASYGGYMMNWIAGNWPEPFKCLINHAGIFDNRFMGYSTEELWFDEWEHGGTPYDVPAAYEKHNPVNHVKDWRVPTLIIAGQKDFRVPYSQSIAAFTALQRRGIPSRLVVFPNENHWILKPSNSIQWHSEVERWLKDWLQQ